MILKTYKLKENLESILGEREGMCVSFYIVVKLYTNWMIIQYNFKMCLSHYTTCILIFIR